MPLSAGFQKRFEKLSHDLAVRSTWVVNSGKSPCWPRHCGISFCVEGTDSGDGGSEGGSEGGNEGGSEGRSDGVGEGGSNGGGMGRGWEKANETNVA